MKSPFPPLPPERRQLLLLLRPNTLQRPHPRRQLRLRCQAGGGAGGEQARVLWGKGQRGGGAEERAGAGAGSLLLVSLFVSLVWGSFNTLARVPFGGPRRTTQGGGAEPERSPASRQAFTCAPSFPFLATRCRASSRGS